MDDLISGDRWLQGFLDRYDLEVSERSLSIHLDGEADFVLTRDARFDEALSRLIHFVFETVPDGCEIYLAAGRPPAPVSRVGAVEVTVRWQVAGRGGQIRDRVVPIHPVAADARTLANAATSKGIRAAFAAAQSVFSLDVVRTGRELIARASKS